MCAWCIALACLAAVAMERSNGIGGAGRGYVGPLGDDDDGLEGADDAAGTDAPQCELVAMIAEVDKTIAMLERSNVQLAEALETDNDPEYRMALEENVGVLVRKHEMRTVLLIELEKLRSAGALDNNNDDE